MQHLGGEAARRLDELQRGEGASEPHRESREQMVPTPKPWRAVGGWEGADLHISGCQLAVPNKHDCDDIQRGLVQSPTQHPY